MKTGFFVALCLIVAVLSFSHAHLGNKVNDQGNEIAALKKQVGNLTATTALTSQDTWYFVKPGEVSSQPDGAGVRISFDPGRDMYNTLPSRARFPNELKRFYSRKVSFARNDNVDNYYAVAGGLLTFRYTEPEGVSVIRN